MVEKIRALWEKHESSPVPAVFRAVVVEGLTLTQIHCDIATNIMTFINTGGRLGSHRVNALVSNTSLLARTIETLPPESKSYCKTLGQISDLVLQQVQH